MNDFDVLIAGAGPVGLTAAVELRRRGVGVRIVDPITEPPQYAKAVGIQPRTLDVFESMGVVEPVLDAGLEMRGQLIYVNGTQVSRFDLFVPDDVPYRFHLMPQYATEQVLRDRLLDFGNSVERGIRVSAFEQDDDAVTVTLTDLDGGSSTVRASYLIGADGAHSTVRKTLGLTFEGGAFPEQYMLADVAVDWSMPRGYAVRTMHQRDDGTTDDLLVAIPLPRSRAVPHVDVRARRAGRRARRAGCRARLRGNPGTRAVPHPGRRRPPCARTRDGLGSALVVGLPHQPPDRRLLLARQGVRRRRCRPYPPADRRAGHEHRDPGRTQPGVEAGPRRPRGRRAGTVADL